MGGEIIYIYNTYIYIYPTWVSRSVCPLKCSTLLGTQASSSLRIGARPPADRTLTTADADKNKRAAAYDTLVDLATRKLGVRQDVAVAVWKEMDRDKVEERRARAMASTVKGLLAYGEFHQLVVAKLNSVDLKAFLSKQQARTAARDKYFHIKGFAGYFGIDWSVDFPPPKSTPPEGGAVDELYHAPSEEIETFRRVSLVMPELLRRNDKRYSCCGAMLVSANFAMRLKHIERGVPVATSDVSIHLSVSMGKRCEQGARRGFTSLGPFESFYSTGDELREWVKVWNASRQKNPNLDSMLWDHTDHKPISSAQCIRRINSVLDDFDIRKGHAAGILNIRSALANSFSIRGSSATLYEAYAALEYVTPKGIPVPSGDSALPIRYASNRRDTTEWTRKTNARVFQLAINTRSWAPSEPLLWESVRPLITAEVHAEAVRMINEEMTSEARRPRGLLGGDEYVRKLEMRRYTFSDRNEAIPKGGFFSRDSAASSSSPPLSGVLPCDDTEPVEDVDSEDEHFFDTLWPTSRYGQVHLLKGIAPLCGDLLESGEDGEADVGIGTTVADLREAVRYRPFCQKCFEASDADTQSQLLAWSM